MIYAVKEFSDVPFPKITSWIRFQKLLGSFNGSNDPFIRPARPGIVDESFVVNIDQIIINEPVDDPIPDACHGNFPLFVIANNKFFIPAVAIRFILKVCKKLGEIFFQTVLEFMQFRGLSFSFSESKPALPYIS